MQAKVNAPDDMPELQVVFPKPQYALRSAGKTGLLLGADSVPTV